MNFSTAGIPVDLILFGMIAAFLILRLRSVLGKRTGADRPAMPVPGRRPQAPPVIEARAEEPAPQARPLPDPSGPVGAKLGALRELDRSFDAGAFLRGAEGAFRRIVGAFAAGDRQALRSLLNADAFHSFEAAITAREAAGQTQRSDIKAIHQAGIEGVDIADGGAGGGRRAAIECRFVSDQISVLVGADGQPLTGTDAVTELADSWVFERFYPGEPSWRLAEARSA